ncbi:hypothetical protein ABTD98_20475, partial [Acinetobacter baumannii]
MWQTARANALAAGIGTTLRTPRTSRFGMMAAPRLVTRGNRPLPSMKNAFNTMMTTRIACTLLLAASCVAQAHAEESAFAPL